MQTMRLRQTKIAAYTVAAVALVLSVLTEFEVIPPLVDWRPRWGSTHGYVATLLMAVAALSDHVGLWLGRRQRALARTTQISNGTINNR
jgi:hypothetical protein